MPARADAVDAPDLGFRARRPVAETILRVATRLFGERGFSGVSLADIGRAAGRSEGVVHHYFASKKKLIAATEERVRLQSDLRLREAIALSTAGVGQLLRTVRRVWSEPAATALRLQLWSEAGRDRDLRQRLVARRRQARVLFADAISAGRTNGKTVEASIDSLAVLVSAVFDGLSISEQIEPESQAAEDAFDLFVRLVATALGEDPKSESRLRAAAPRPVEARLSADPSSSAE